MLIFIFGISIFSIFLTNQVQSQDNSISFSPNRPLCNGDVVEMVCILESSVAFSATIARVSINSSAPFTLANLNTDVVIDNIDLSRYSASVTGLTLNLNIAGIRVSISSYQPSDSATTFGCHAVLGDGSVSSALVSGQPNVSADPPSISILIPTIQNFNPSTCEGTLRFNLAATSDRNITSYSILFNGSSILEQIIAPSSTEFTHNTQFLLNTNYPTSIIASSCAGNSTDGDASLRVNGYMQSEVSCAQYNNVTGTLTIDWTLNTPSQPTGVSGINIAYSVRVTYSHCNGTVTYLFTDTPNFNLMSFVTTYDVPLTAHNFTNPQRVETNITAHLRILQQCGQDLIGTELSCNLSSVIVLPETTTSTVSTIPSVSSSTSSILTSNNTSSTPTRSTNTPCCTCSNTGESSQLIIPNVILGLLFFIAVIIIAMLMIVLIFMARKNKQLNSALTVKPAPSHPYEYIDLDKMSDNISSPTQQQSPQDYVPMSSVHKQDPNKPPPFYANLK